MKKIIAIAALTLCAPLSWAQSMFLSGTSLLAAMTSTNPAVRMEAIGYVKGVADAYAGKGVCIPPDQVPAQQILDMTRAMIERNPSKRTLPASDFVSGALIEIWPCRSNRSM